MLDWLLALLRQFARMLPQAGGAEATMATQTKQIISFDDDACIWEYDYDDVNLRLTRIRCTNNGAFNTRGTVTVNKNGRVVTRLVGPGETLDQSIPTGAAVRLEITVDARGRIDGIDWSFSYGQGIT